MAVRRIKRSRKGIFPGLEIGCFWNVRDGRGLFRRGELSFVAFDLLCDAGKDLRLDQLLDR